VNITDLKKTLKEYEIAPNKKLGQNFLIDGNIVKKIVEAADVSRQDTILEIGSGLGTLTKDLADQAKKVIAIEKDKKIAKILKESLKDCDNIEVIHNDILKMSNPVKGEYKIVSNLPYYITSPVIRMFLERSNPPQQMTFIVQKEVAQRICAQPPRMNILAVSVQVYAKPKIVSSISQNCFYPKPKVDSAIINISKIKKPKGIDMKKFFKLIRAGFSSPRKQLANNLQSLNIPREQTKRALAECGLDPQARAQELNINDWILLLQSSKPSDMPDIFVNPTIPPFSARDND